MDGVIGGLPDRLQRPRNSDIVPERREAREFGTDRMPSRRSRRVVADARLWTLVPLLGGVLDRRFGGTVSEVE